MLEALWKWLQREDAARNCVLCARFIRCCTLMIQAGNVCTQIALCKNIQKWYQNKEILKWKVQKCCRSRGQCMHTICALQKYKDQKYTNTNTKNTEMQIQKVQKCCWSRGKSMHAICALHKYKEKNAELQRQIIEKYKYKKSKNAADPGGKCMHAICALQSFTRPLPATPKQLTKCENP